MAPTQDDINKLKQTRTTIQDGIGTSVNKDAFIKMIKDMLPESTLLQKFQQAYTPGEVLTRENQPNYKLFIILDGYVAQVKKAGLDEESDETIAIDLQGPGDFIGLLSFQTGGTAFTTAKANGPINTLTVDRESFNMFLTRYPEIGRVLQGLIFSNLSERYRRVVTLHMEVAYLSKQLETERNELQKTIVELERTRNILISQEKMATLGELTAGLAHEINNPASALLRSVDYLINRLPGLAEQASSLPETQLVRHFFEAGLNRELTTNQTQREKMAALADKYAHLNRSKVRTMAEMSDTLLDEIHPYANNKKNQQLLDLLLECYQSGVFLNSIRLSTGRIEHLVRSLKSYSRQSGAQPELVDLRVGLKETVMILGNRLKDIKVDLHLPQVPEVLCYVGEINQVWTNIIINACDAMDDEGGLFISCGTDADDMVWIRIGDTGPGVPDHLKKRIFDSSFTTKTAGGEFGLGIGLAISKGIIERHSGTIEVRDRKGGGAEFLIRLPFKEG